MRWSGDAMLLPRLPVRYDDWGIREAWKAPVLVRMAADMRLPPGKQTLLVPHSGLESLVGRRQSGGADEADLRIAQRRRADHAGRRTAGPGHATHRASRARTNCRSRNQRTANNAQIVLEALAGGVEFPPHNRASYVLRFAPPTAKSMRCCDRWP